MHLLAKHDKQKQEGWRVCDEWNHPSPASRVENVGHYLTNTTDNTSPSTFKKKNPSSALYKPGRNKREDQIPQIGFHSETL